MEDNGDFVNAVFEAIGAVFVLMHVQKLQRDKEVKGVSILATIFFTAWGMWNVYFYPNNGLMWSFIGGIFICLANLIWVIQLIYYSKFYDKN